MSANRVPARGFISELDGLRGVAILLVMVHRFWPRTGVGVAADAAGAGWIGVDLFFVISGFLITGILLDTRGDRGFFRNFYARRILRIFPLYYLFVIGVLVAFSGNPAFREHAGSPFWYLFHLGNVPEGLLDKDVPYWLAPVWSLAIEEQFYLTFPLVVWLVGRRWLGHVLVGMILAAPLIRYGTMLAAPEQERIQYLFTLCRIDTIAIGCLLAVLARRFDVEAWRGRSTTILAVAFGVGAAISIATGLDRTTAFGRVLGYSAVAVGSAGLVGLVVLWRGAPVTGLLRITSLRYLGKLCFGLYLLHRPADTIVSALADRVGIDADLRILPLKIAVAVVFASLSWWLIETRFLRLKGLFASEHHPSAAPPAGPQASTGGTTARAARRALGSWLSGALVLGVGLAISIALSLGGCGNGGAAGPADGGGDAGAVIDAGDAWFDATADGGRDARGSDAMDAMADAMPDAPGDAMADAPIDAMPDAMVDAGIPPSGVVLYPENRRHSPLSPQLVARLQAIASAAAHVENVFAKVGDSITAAPAFLRCFDGGTVELGAHTALAPTLAHYLAGDAAGSSPFVRASLAAIGGTTTADVLAGSPSPLVRELDAVDPRLAVILFGTNDVRFGRTLDAFANDLWTIVDTVIARGTVPILSTIPAINGDPGTDARIPTFNRAIRALAQGRGIPLVDLHRELAPLPSRGLSADGLHPSVAADGGCILTATGLQYGYDVRNLITVEALARTRAALAGTASDASAIVRAGDGSAIDPLVGALPLADLGDTRHGDAAGDHGCGGASGGREIVYRLELTAAVTLDASVIPRAQTEANVHLLVGGLAPANCVASGDRQVSAVVGPGTVYLVIDAPATATEGEYLLVAAAR